MFIPVIPASVTEFGFSVIPAREWPESSAREGEDEKLWDPTCGREADLELDPGLRRGDVVSVIPAWDWHIGKFRYTRCHGTGGSVHSVSSSIRTPSRKWRRGISSEAGVLGRLLKNSLQVPQGCVTSKIKHLECLIFGAKRELTLR